MILARFNFTISNVYRYHRDMSEQLESRTAVEHGTAQEYEALAGELRLQWWDALVAGVVESLVAFRYYV